jgi:hypothetical protein
MHYFVDIYEQHIFLTYIMMNNEDADGYKGAGVL